MANNDYESLSDWLQTDKVAANYLLLNADRNRLPAHPAFFYAGDVAGLGSKTIRVPKLGMFGYDVPTSLGQGARIVPRQISDAQVTVSAGRHGKAYQFDDLARIVLPNGSINRELLALDAVVSADVKLLQMVCDLLPNFTGAGGVTGVDFDTAAFLAGRGVLLGRNVQGPFLSIMHTKEHEHMTTELALAAGGAVQYQQATAEQIQLRTDMYKGAFLGVDVCATTRVALSGSDYVGGMLGANAIAWLDGTIATDGPDPQQAMLTNKVLFERIREALAGQTAFASQFYRGVALAHDDNGVKLVGDST